MRGYTECREICKQDIADVLGEIAADVRGLQGILEMISEQSEDRCGGVIISSSTAAACSDLAYTAWRMLDACVERINND